MSAWMELIVGLVKPSAWPIAAISLGLMFKANIPDLLNRLEEIGPKGAKFAQKVTQDTATSPYEEARLDDGEVVALAPLSPAAKEMVNRLRSDLVRFKSDQHIDVLIGDLAFSRLELGHEKTYRKAFGSQLSFLRELNTTGSIQISSAKVYFDSHTKNYIEFYQGYGFNGWLHFLEVGGLISLLNDKVDITVIGHAFVEYLASMRLPENKRY